MASTTKAGSVALVVAGLALVGVAGLFFLLKFRPEVVMGAGTKQGTA